MITIWNKIKDSFKENNKYYISTIIFILVVSISSALIYHNKKINSYSDIMLTLEENSIEYTSNVDKEFSTNLSYFSTLGDLLLESIDEYSGEINQDNFSTILKRSDESENIIDKFYYVSNITGSNIRATGITDLEDMPVDLRQREWYKKAISCDGACISEEYLDINTGKPCITISYAVKKDGRILGVFSGDIFIENIYYDYFNTTKEKKFSIVVISEDGRTIINQSNIEDENSFSELYVSDHYGRKYFNDNLLWEEILKISSNKVEFFNSNGKLEYGYYSTSDVLGWKVFCIIQDSEMLEEINNSILKFILIWIFGCSILLCILHLYFYLTDKYDRMTGFIKLRGFTKYLEKKNKFSQDIELLFVRISNLEALRSEISYNEVEGIFKDYSKVLKLIVGAQGKIAFGNEGDFIVFFYTKKNDSELEEITEKIKTETSFNKIKLDNEILAPESKFALVSFKNNKFLNMDIQVAEKNIQANEYNITKLNKIEYKELKEKSEDLAKKLKTLRKAINNGDLVPFYQPIYDLKNNTVAKFEVLMRIKNGDEFLSPYPYILIGEKFNLIEEMDLVIFEKALQYKKVIDEKDEIVFSFNISGKCLNNDDYLRKANDILENLNIKPENIEFEITETESISNIDFLVEMINKYIEKGYSFLIDDFGIAYSNIDYLRKIPCYCVKIDGSFIRDINISEQSLYLVKAIINMARAYDKKVLAEFVESKEILDKIKEIDIDYGQGYYHGKPSEEIDTLTL